MRRDGPPADYARAMLTEQEIQQLRDVVPFIPDLVEIAQSRRNITAGGRFVASAYRGIKAFCFSFIVFSGMAVAFKQSVLDFTGFIRGLIK